MPGTPTRRSIESAIEFARKFAMGDPAGDVTSC